MRFVETRSSGYIRRSAIIRVDVFFNRSTTATSAWEVFAYITAEDGYLVSAHATEAKAREVMLDLVDEL